MAKRPTFTSPAGILAFPCYVREPDTKFADLANEHDKGNFVARLRLPKEAASTKKFLAELTSHWDQYIAEMQANLPKNKKLKIDEESLPWMDEVDRDSGEPTGNILLKAKLKARVVVQKTKKIFDQRVKVFDSKGRLINPVPNVGPGSTAKVAGAINLWTSPLRTGMSLYFEGLQLLDLVETGNRDAGSYGFGEEDGYVADDGVDPVAASMPSAEGETPDF